MPRTATDLLDYLSDPATTLPEPFALDDMAARIVGLHEQSGGATFNPYFGDMSGQPLFAVSVFPEASAVESGFIISPMLVRGFIRQHHHLLLDPRNNIGTWYNIPEDETYLDVSTVFLEQEEAFTLAARCNQIAFYDLAQGDAIPTFGTGEDTVDLPPEGERLPPLDQVRRSNTNGNNKSGSHQGGSAGSHG